MAFTGKLGTVESRLGNLQLGSIGTVDPFALSAASNISFSNSAIAVVRNTESLTSTLTFVQVATAFNSIKKVSQSIAFVSNASAEVIYERSLSDTLVFYTLAEAEKRTLASNSITFTDEATAEVTKGAFNTLTFSQLVTHQYDPHSDSDQSTVAFANSVTVVAIRPRTVANALVFAQEATAQRVRFFSAANELVFTNNVISLRISSASNTLVFSQTADVVRIRNRSASNTLNFVQTPHYNAVFTRSLTSTIAFNPGMGFQKDDGSGGLVFIPWVQVVKVNFGVCTLQIPGLAINLPTPELGDSEGALGKMVMKRTLSGGTFTYARRNRSRELKYKFSISRTKAFEMRNFTLNALSQKIYLTNWKGELWYGNITNNPLELTAQKTTGDCNGEGYEFDLTFQGVRVN